MQARVTTTTQPLGAIIAIGLGLTAAYVVLLLVLMDRSTFDVWGGVLILPVLVAVSIPALKRQSAREHDPTLFRLLVLALLVKLGGAVARYFVAFSVYEGVADASGYHGWGIRLARGFWRGDFDTGLETLTGTDFMRFITGIAYTAIGPAKLAGFFFFSWLGFWGLFFYYRAFVMAVPQGRGRTYARMLFFLPSLVFWPSSIGKESWMTFTLGLAALGCAYVLAKRTSKGIVVASIGLWLAALMRPHVAGMLALALTAGYVIKRPRPELRQLAPLAKGVALAIIAVVAFVLVIRTDRFLHGRLGIEEGDPSLGNVTGQLESTAERTGKGGSGFAPSVVDSPARAPLAAVTVLFRPLPFEAHNAQSLASALEGAAVFAILAFHWRWLLSSLRNLRGSPYLALCVVYAALFIIGFSSIANFGILARQRVQLYPLLFVLFSVPPLGSHLASADQGP